jgi:hypothetical protein
VKLRAVVALGAIIAGVSLPAISTVTPVAAASTATATVSITPAESGDAHAGQPLKLFLTIDDQIGAGISAGTATITVDRTPISSRASLDLWYSNTTKTSAASAVLSTVATPAITPGLTRVVSITIPASALKLGPAGVYAIGVSVRSGGNAVGSGRTAIGWKTSGAHPVPLALAAPLTVPATSGTFIDAKTLADYTAPSGILTTELSDLQNTQVAIGIDPRIIASINILGKSAPQSAIDWLQQLKGVSNDTFPLAWADADLTVALHAGAKVVPTVKSLDFAIDPSRFSAANTTSATPTPTPTIDPSDPPLPTSASLTQWDYTLPQMSWPAESSVVNDDIAKIRASGITSAILSSTNVKWASASASLGASAKVSGMPVAVSDSSVSEYLREAALSTTRTDWNAAMAKLSTSLDLVSIESGTNPRVMLATFGRDWANSDTEFAHTINTVYSKSWVTPAMLSAVTTAAPSTVKIVSEPQSTSRVDLVRSMLVNEVRVDRFAEITGSYQPTLTSTRRLLLLSLLSDEWLQDPAGWATLATAYVTESHKILTSVTAVKSSEVVFLGNQASFPVTVSNNGNLPVTVYVAIRPTTTLLSVDKNYRMEAVEVPANSQHRAEIPVQSVANGKVAVQVFLYSKSGRQIGATTVIDANVQAGWETIGTLAFGALIVAIFTFGIIRNIRKRRRARTEDPEEGQA